MITVCMITVCMITVCMVTVCMVTVMRFVQMQIHKITKLLGSHQAFVWVRYPRKIFRSSLHVQLTQHAVTPRPTPLLGDCRLRIRDIPEFDCSGWACRLTGSDHIPISNTATLFDRVDFGTLNPLNAVSALFHHTATANSHLRIHH